jgi:OFA family oxalate/formate antiporter-like MFS transporter
MAIAFFTTSAGGAALPPLVQLVISAWHWRAAWALLGAIVFVLGLLPTVVLVRRRPEDLGLAVDGEAAPDDRHALTAEAVESASGHSETAWPLGRALRDATLWLLLPAVWSAPASPFT